MWGGGGGRRGVGMFPFLLAVLHRDFCGGQFRPYYGLLVSVGTSQKGGGGGGSLVPLTDFRGLEVVSFKV